MLAAGWRFRAQNTSPEQAAANAARRADHLAGGTFQITGRGVKMRTAFWLAGATALALANPAVAADSIKIGFVSTFSGPTAVIGNGMGNSFELAVATLGRTMGGKPVEVIYERLW